MPALQFSKDIGTNPEGYPLYPVSEDIYQQCEEEVNIDPEDITCLKDPDAPGIDHQKDFEEAVSGAVRLEIQKT